jgi:hypothetical protein
VVPRFTPYVQSLFARLCRTGVGSLTIYFNAEDYNDDIGIIQSAFLTLKEHARALHSLHLDFSNRATPFSDRATRTNKIGNAGAHAMVVLAELHALVRLHIELGENRIYDAGAIYLARFKNMNLTELWLGLAQNEISSDGATQLAFLKRMPTLERLAIILDWNLDIRSSSAGTHALIEYTNGPRLRSLLITNRQFGLLVELDRVMYRHETYGYPDGFGRKFNQQTGRYETGTAYTYEDYFRMRGEIPHIRYIALADTRASVGPTHIGGDDDRDKLKWWAQLE